MIKKNQISFEVEYCSKKYLNIKNETITKINPEDLCFPAWGDEIDNVGGALARGVITGVKRVTQLIKQAAIMQPDMCRSQISDSAVSSRYLGGL